MQRIGVVFGAALATAAVTMASQPTVDVGEQARRATRVVIGTVLDVESAFEVNEFGDQLIVSRARLRVDESLKGPRASVITLKVEGGTVGDVTLTVSDMPVVRRGDRAVAFLEEQAPDTFVLHDRGRSLLKVDAGNRIVGSVTTVDDIRAAVRAQSAERTR